MKYVLIKDDVGQIKIIDNTHYLGKKKVESLISEGGELVGFLESELAPNILLRGFNQKTNDILEERRERIRLAINELNRD
ncbi:hypothetical protein [Vallitalea maricola]|uniref:Uncharacterized protein n=1 Tax=Vallitalea maricola TaxID=3074433 RepID=A0ACB5UQN2_9FIRM|nr:hypothetical protein AN2V17_34200 [Vallitalea sp. AN17-2]